MKSRIYLFIFVFVFSSSFTHGESRTWTIITGGSFQAKLTAVHATKVTLENDTGKSIQFPISDLKPSDQKYIQDWQAAQLGESSGETVADVERSDFANRVYKDLVYSKGSRLTRFKPEPTDNPKYFAFYKSASWCPPCRKFTPKLAKFYDKQKRSGAAFELIFISSDQNEDSMADYMKDYDMNFPAFDFGKNKTIVSTKGGGIPNLMVTDANGNKLLDSYDNSGKYIGPTYVLNELEKLLEQ